MTTTAIVREWPEELAFGDEPTAAEYGFEVGQQVTISGFYYDGGSVFAVIPLDGEFRQLPMTMLTPEPPLDVPAFETYLREGLAAKVREREASV